MKITSLLFLYFVMFFISSCSRGPLGSPRDVAYYDKHRDERDQVIAKCANDARLRFEPNCSNAIRARTNMHFGSESSNANPKINMEEARERLRKERESRPSNWDGALDRLANAGNSGKNE